MKNFCEVAFETFFIGIPVSWCLFIVFRYLWEAVCRFFDIPWMYDEKFLRKNWNCFLNLQGNQRIFGIFILTAISSLGLLAYFYYKSKDVIDKDTIPDTLLVILVSAPIAWGLWVWRNKDKYIDQQHEEKKLINDELVANTQTFLIFTEKISNLNNDISILVTMVGALKPFLDGSKGEDFADQSYQFIRFHYNNWQHKRLNEIDKKKQIDENEQISIDEKKQIDENSEAKQFLIACSNALIARMTSPYSLSIERILFYGNVFRGKTMTANFSRFSSMRCCYIKIIFKNCQFKNTIFYYTEFRNCQFKNCKFDFCHFDNTTFNEVEFEDCQFKKLKIESPTFFQCASSNCSFCDSLLIGMKSLPLKTNKNSFEDFLSSISSSSRMGFDSEIDIFLKSVIPNFESYYKLAAKPIKDQMLNKITWTIKNNDRQSL